MHEELNVAMRNTIPAICTSPSKDSSTLIARFEPFIAVEETAGLLTLHPVTLLRWAREGRVPHHRFGRRVVFRLSELEKWLSSGQPAEAGCAAA